MEKRPTNKTSPKNSGRFVRPGILGQTRDGINIIEPRQSATHFTEMEVAQAVRTARSSRFVGNTSVPKPGKGRSEQAKHKG